MYGLFIGNYYVVSLEVGEEGLSVGKLCKWTNQCCQTHNSLSSQQK